MNKQSLAEKVATRLLETDEFSKWLGIEVLEIKPGYSRVKMKIRSEMLNGFKICHGGVIFSIADSAFAFASNSHGRFAVAIETSIAFPNPVKEGDDLTAVAEEQSIRNSIAVYNIIVTNQSGEKVGIFRGTVYRSKEEYFPNE
jgi:acyl-CoA thioesterase